MKATRHKAGSVPLAAGDSTRTSALTRRALLLSGAATAALAALSPAMAARANAPQRAAADAIRPFRIHVPRADLADLRRRVNATRWPDMETVADSSQGVQLANLRELVQYWGTRYDWRKAEARLNALPQFVTHIDGVDIHFIHVRSRNPDAMPLIMTHGWPGSVFEMLSVIDPLTNPTAHGGRASDAFDLVIPSIPGYGFSARPTSTGWGPERISRAWGVLMERLGYSRYVAQGGDWGAPITNAMARQTHSGLLGIHLNLPATVPLEVATALAVGAPAPAGLSQQERAVFDALVAFRKTGNSAYITTMNECPPNARLRHHRLTGRPCSVAARASRLCAVDVRP